MPEGDDDVEQEDATQSVPPEPISRDVSEPMILPLKGELPSKASSPKPHPLSISFGPPLASEQVDDAGLSGALQGLEDELAGQVDVAALEAADLVDLDLSQLGPDGTAFDAAGDLSQLQSAENLLGGDTFDTTLPGDDPFVMEST